MTTPAPNDEQPRVAQLLGVGIVVVPAVLATVRAFWLAHGDMLIMMDVLRRVDFVSLLAGSVMLSLQSGAVLLLLAGYRAFLMFRLGRAATLRVLPTGLYLWTSALLVALVLLTSNYWISGITVLASVAFGTVSFDRPPVRRRVLGAGVAVASVMVGTFVLALAATAPWPPPELLRVTSEPSPRWVYVLSVEDTHTTVLYPEGGVARLANNDVAERALCPEEAIRARVPGWGPSALRSLLADSSERKPSGCAHTPPTGGL